MRESPKTRNSLIIWIPPALSPGISVPKSVEKTNIELRIRVTVPKESTLVCFNAKIGVSEIRVIWVINITVFLVETVLKCKKQR
jgi:hypothetical protein